MDTQGFEALKQLSLLYVEDDAETREELAMMLEPWVGTLHLAADGQAGLDLFKDKRPDLVITDIQMPRMSGLALSAEIRRLALDQPIILISAFNDAEYLFRAIELGIDQYIPKPVNVKRMLAKLAHTAQVQLTLKERERNRILLEQYKHLVDQSAIICKLDNTGLITYVNDKLCDISGFTSSDLIGRDLAVLRHNQLRGEGWDVARAGRKWTGIVRNRSCQGKPYVVESSLVPILNENAEVVEIICLDVDITGIYEDHAKLAAALDSSNFSLLEQRHFLAEYKHALELGACVCVTDARMAIISINRQFERLLGYSALELKGKSLCQIATNISRGDCLDDIAHADSVGNTNRIVRFRGRDGREMQFSVGCVAVHSLSGEIESIILICHDITEFLRLSQDIVETQRELLYMMGDVIESRSEETGQHVKRVAIVSRFLALKAGLDPDMADMIETAAPMHDVGKVGIRDAILNKPGKYEAHEYEEMKHHTLIGQSILGKVNRPLIRLAATIALQHHERWDGTGYPNGLVGEQISIAARIVAIADTLDALFAQRVYKPAWAEPRVLDYFGAQRGLQFDPTLVDLLVTHWDTIRCLRNSHPF
ncbi:MAG: PAS domain S-box protein [Rhodoferax sp.]|uniref:HD domain-containing phosphohydrolase n=1 Tax=Rhodoferax sp. TaxID=50421 RepID=UPI0026149932|nr:HD domain-containing phosphohydrolase [Rhodoferax sp.]MDD2881366.1 PAS domain S-box protein [Rhodoferax sp.]